MTVLVRRVEARRRPARVLLFDGPGVSVDPSTMAMFASRWGSSLGVSVRVAACERGDAAAELLRAAEGVELAVVNPGSADLLDVLPPEMPERVRRLLLPRHRGRPLRPRPARGHRRARPRRIPLGDQVPARLLRVAACPLPLRGGARPGRRAAPPRSPRAGPGGRPHPRRRLEGALAQGHHGLDGRRVRAVRIRELERRVPQARRRAAAGRPPSTTWRARSAPWASWAKRCRSTPPAPSSSATPPAASSRSGRQRPGTRR